MDKMFLNNKIEANYLKAKELIKEEKYNEASELLFNFLDYKDASSLYRKCEEEISLRENIMHSKSCLSKKFISSTLYKKIKNKLSSYKDKEIKEVDDILISLKKKRKNTIVFTTIFSATLVASLLSVLFAFVVPTYISPKLDLNSSLNALNKKDLDKCIEILEKNNYGEAEKYLEYATSIKSEKYNKIILSSDKVKIKYVCSEFHINYTEIYEFQDISNISIFGVDNFLNDRFYNLVNNNTQFEINGWSLKNLTYAIEGEKNIRYSSFELIPNLSFSNYKITYQLDDGIFTENNIITTYNLNSNFVLPKPLKKGHEFLYWSDVENNERIDSIAPKHTDRLKDLTLKANYKRKRYNICLTIDKKIGETVGSGIFSFGETVNISAHIKEGFEFICWINKNTGDIVSDKLNATIVIPDNDLILEAKCAKNTSILLNSYNEKDEVQNSGGKIVSSGTFEINTLVGLYAIPNENYYFVGWFENGIKKYEDEHLEFILEKPILNLIAHFDEKAKVNVSIKDEDIGKGEAFGTGYYSPGEKAIINIKPKKGYDFIVDNNIPLEQVKESTYELEIKKKTYAYDIVIDFYEQRNDSNYNYAEIQDDQKHMGHVKWKTSHNSHEVLILEAICNPGYQFCGWFNNREKFVSCENSLFYNNYIPWDELPMLAKFAPDFNENLEIYNGQDHMGKVYAEEKYKYLNKIKISAIPNLGYTFDGWYINGELYDKNNITFVDTSDQNNKYVAHFSNLFAIENHFTLGKYPQERVNDPKLIDELNNITPMPSNDSQGWNNYHGWHRDYSKQTAQGNDSCYYYRDFDYKDSKYRAIITSYWPQEIRNNQFIYFKYQDISWNIISNGIAWCDLVLDASYISRSVQIFLNEFIDIAFNNDELEFLAQGSENANLVGRNKVFVFDAMQYKTYVTNERFIKKHWTDYYEFLLGRSGYIDESFQLNYTPQNQGSYWGDGQYVSLSNFNHEIKTNGRPNLIGQCPSLRIKEIN